MSAKVHILDKTKYPVFRIKKMTLPQTDYLDSKSKIVLTAKIEGSISQFKKDNCFGIYTIIQSNRDYYLELIFCYIPMPSKVENNFQINCYLNIDQKVVYYNPQLIYFPYPFPKETTSPFEVIFDEDNLDDDINEYNENEDTESFIRIRTYSKFNQVPFFLCMLPLLALLLF